MSLSSLLKNAAIAHKLPPKNVDRIIIDKKNWSIEQELFLESQTPKMLLTALAGTGKTSILMEYVKRRSHQKWIFLAFNRSVVDTWSKIAPKNMTVKTAHQLAFERFGKDLHNKLSENDLDIKTLLNHSNSRFNNIKDKQRALYLKSLIIGLDNFCKSNKNSIDFSLCDKNIWDELLNEFGFDSWSEEKWVNDLLFIWKLSLDSSSNLPITHDIYLKRFVMIDEMDSWGNKNYILDEAQDWPESFLFSFDKTTNSIRAGDPFQSLYEFRGASPIWDRGIETEFVLTKSFRTGRGLESIINKKLKLLNCKYIWQPADHSCQIYDLKENSLNISKFKPNVILASTWNELDKIKSMINDEKIIYTTIHSAKGMDFDRVWIADNWASKSDFIEKNKLAYVALTRAKFAIRLPENMLNNKKLLNAFE